MVARDELKRVITARLEAFCRERGYALSPNREPIIDDLVAIHLLEGDFYCPCQPANTQDTVCVCQPVRLGLVEEMGACFCHLILARETGQNDIGV